MPGLAELFTVWPQTDGATFRQHMQINHSFVILITKRIARLTQDGRPFPRYRSRWSVERLFAWLHWFRRLVIRWGYHVENSAGMVQLGCSKTPPEAYLRPVLQWSDGRDRN